MTYSRMMKFNCYYIQITRTTKNFNEQIDYRLSRHAKDAAEKSKNWAKFFK